MDTGIPMARILFADHPVGAIALSLMLFHQIQLMVCALLAQRYASHEIAGTSNSPTAAP